MIQKKRKRRAVLDRVAPTTGRQAFRGMIQPLMLAGGSNPNAAAMIGEVYTNAITTQAIVNEQKAMEKQVCPMSYVEAQACQWNNTLPFCKKRNIAADDPQCQSIGSMECPLTDTLKKVCDAGPTDPLYRYRDFCRLKKINGQCLEQGMNTAPEPEKPEKTPEEKAKQEAYDKWVATRQCKLANGLYTQTFGNGCFPAFRNAKIGDSGAIPPPFDKKFGPRMTLIEWIPAKP